MLKKIKDWIGSNLDVYKVESASDVGAGLYRHVWKGKENATQIGTTLNAEIMNNLQNSLVHSINATKTTGTGTDYYICNLEGLTEFGLNNDLKLRITVDNANTNATTKLRLNNVDYTLLKEQNGTLKQIEAGDIHSNKTYELIYNGSQFVVINLFKNFESSYLDNCIKKTDYATENKAGIVTLGTTANTALEGKRLAEIIGMEFGGKIQDSGIKTAGKFYYDTVTKFYYECIADTNLTYNDATKFRAISNKPLSDKVESLSEIKEYIFVINGLTNGKIVKIGKLAHFTIDSGTHFYNKGAEAVVLNIPQGFRPRDLVNFSAVNLSNVPNSFRIATNGNVIKVFSDSKNGAYYFSVTYFTD